MSNEASNGSGPLRHFRVGRRAVLTSLATGVGAAAFVSSAAAASAHVHHASAAAVAKPELAAAEAASSPVFLDQHGFDTLAALAEQIVPGARAAHVPEVIDRLLSVESLETQKRVTQVLGTFEREARAAHGKPWKALSAEEASALLTKISSLPEDEPTRQAFNDLKGAVAETYYSTEPGMKELGWTGTIAFATPAVCG